MRSRSGGSDDSEAKRAELLGLIRDYERAAERLWRDLAHLDAALRIFKPDAASLDGVEPKRTAARTYFRRGMLAREALALVRAAGRPVGAREIATRLAAEHGLDPCDAGVVNTLIKSVNRALRRHDGLLTAGAGRAVVGEVKRLAPAFA